MSDFVKGYTVSETIYEGENTIVYRGIREVDHVKVVIKISKNPYPTAIELDRYRHQFNILQTINLSGILKAYSLENSQKKLALILEDYDGTSLSNFLDQKFGSDKNHRENLSKNHISPKIPTDLFFEISLQICEILEYLNKNNIIHKDIKPENILIHPKTLEVKLIDFSIASSSKIDIKSLSKFNNFEGTLAYISPEQTGRINRSLDYRTDYYSLGVTFYKLLTGHLPFQSENSLELFHNHIASIPVSISQIVKEVPKSLCQIVEKLMSKSPDDRYQSSAGLKADLLYSKALWLEGKHAATFKLGENDVSHLFLISNKLYGRDAELELLITSLDNVTQGGMEFISLSGTSGAGKTRLINEFRKFIVQKGVYFIEGKFDQIQGDIPLSGLLQAFRMLLDNILNQSNTNQIDWKERVLQFLKNNGQLIVEVLPELENLIGKQPTVLDVDPISAQNRFNFVFQRFIQAFPSRDTPLVIFLDDLQWADLVSLNLIKSLLIKEYTPYFCIIGSYRCEEISLSQTLKQTLDELKNFKIPFLEISLSPLQPSSLALLIQDSFRCSESNSLSLADLIYQVSEGNPYYNYQILGNLYDDNLIKFDWLKRSWQWDPVAVQSSLPSDSIIDFVRRQILKLSPLTQRVLEIASCFGYEFSLKLIIEINNFSVVDVFNAISNATQAGLIFPKHYADSLYREVLDPQKKLTTIGFDPDLDSVDYNAAYLFAHDRVQQAAYSLISKEQKAQYHYKIGKYMLEEESSAVHGDSIFASINQLNLGLSYVESNFEKIKIGQLNYFAGLKAKSATAYKESYKYFLNGIICLDKKIFIEETDLIINLHLEAGETAFLMGCYDLMEEHIQYAENSTSDIFKLVKAKQIKIESLKARGQVREAIETGILTLEMLGISVPIVPEFEKFYNNFCQIQSDMEKLCLSEIVDLPLAIEKKLLVCMDLLGELLPITYSYNPLLFSILILKLINFSLEFGNSPSSSFSYLAYGIIVWKILGKLDYVYELGLIGKNLGIKIGSNHHLSVVGYAFEAFINIWKNHLRNTLAPLLSNYLLSLESGNLVQAAYSLAIYFEHSFLSGKFLVSLDSELEDKYNNVYQLNQEIPFRFYCIYANAVKNLIENKIQSSENFQDINYLSKTANFQALFINYFFLLQNNLIFNQYQEAIKNSDNAFEYLDSVQCRVVVPIYYFYNLLARLAVFLNMNSSDQQQTLKIFEAQFEDLKKYAESAPMNFQHKLYLVQAEWFRVQGYHVEAIEAYDLAIAGAQENEYLNDEAIAHELAGLFYLNWGKATIAQTYLVNAYYAYEKWGAKAKVKVLEKQFSEMLGQFKNILAPAASSLLRTSSGDTVSNTNSSLDWLSIMKASQALSQEMEQDKLLSTIMKVIIENAGAEKGSLLLVEAEQLVLKAYCELTSSHTIDFRLHSQLAHTVGTLPQTLINHVDRTQKALVLADATADINFESDQYVVQYQPRSVLCMPIQQQGKRVGILYLENNQVTDAFTKNRLEVLRVLIAQAAISLENAQLYTSIEQKVKERTLELETAKQEAERAKDKAVQADRAKSEFLANMSHELRTPLNAVLGFSQILHRDPSASSEQQKKLSIIRRSGEHLLTLINDVLTMSKIESGRTTLNEASFNVQQMLSSLHDMLSLKASEKNLRFQFHAAEDIPRFIYTDEVKLRQVLINLLGNAIKFTQQGSVLLSISLDSSQETSTMSSTAQNSITLNFKVEDTGPGIASDEMNALFQAFSQTKVGRQSQEGTGLGLSISRTFVQLMGGDIRVTSQPGQGSSFCFNIKVGLPEPLASVNSTELGNVIGLEPNQPQYRILVVDDKLENQQVLSEMLDMVGFEVGVASNGQEAIEIWQTYPFDLIFMDLLMPLMDGYEASRQILKTAKNQEKLPIIIAITADTSKVTQQNLQENLFQDIQTKPIQIENLLKVIAKHLGVRYLYEGTVQAQTVEQSNELYASYTHASSIDFERLPQSWIKEVISAASTLDESTLMVLVAQIKQEHPAVSEAILKLMDSFDFETIIQQLQPFLVK